MSFHAFLGVISAVAVLIPGLILLWYIPGMKIRVLRNLSILLASFAILHGVYHLLLIGNLSVIGNPLDLVTAVLVMLVGLYYAVKVA
jgi:hypothetical protein